MCQAKPGRRCTDSTYKRYAKAKDAYENPPAGTTGLQRGYAKTEFILASADYAATFPKVNPGLHAVAVRIRDEQVALMPTKPAINEPGHEEYQALADARHRLATALTAAHGAELVGGAAPEITQNLFEQAVLETANAEKAFRAVAWSHYDVTEAARAELLEADDARDPQRLERAKAAFYLSQNHTWTEDAQRRYRAALATNDEKTIDAAWRERELAQYAQSQMPRLVNLTYPHSLLHRELPGERLAPAPWIGQGRPVVAADAAQVRFLSERSATQTRWSNTDNCVYVTSLNGSTEQRLWAYGFHTEPADWPGVLRVTRGPDLTERREVAAASAARGAAA